MSELDDFLSSPPVAAPEPAPEPQSQPQEPAQAQADPTPPTQRETPQAATQAPVEPADAGPEREREPQHFRELRQSVETYKREREDWKSRAIRAETERDEVRKQFESASRHTPPPQQQPQQPQQPQMDIREAMASDPSIKAAVLTRLDTSEMLLRRELGDEAVTKLQADFQAAMAEDPSLQTRVLTQRDPYKWAHEHMESIRFRKSVGDNPAAYRAQVRAEIEAEMAGVRNGNGGVPAPPRPSPAAGMSPSLATARSAAPLHNPGWSGEPTLDAIVQQIHQPRR